MSDTRTPQPDPIQVEQPDGAEPETTVDYPTPFLRITGTFPAPDDRVEQVCLEMNLGPDQTMGDIDPDTGGAVTSWFTDFCTQVITSLRRTPDAAKTIVISGSGVAGLFAGPGEHADNCAGDCGQPTLFDNTAPPADQGSGDPGAREDRRQYIADRAYAGVDLGGRAPEPAPAAEQNTGGA